MKTNHRCWCGCTRQYRAEAPRRSTPERRQLVGELHTLLLAAQLGGQIAPGDYRLLLDIIGEL